MRTGLLYFLKFDRITWVARVIFVIIVLVFAKLPPQGSAMPTAITIGCITGAISLIHVRSNRYVRNVLNDAEKEFITDFRRHYELSENCEIHIVKSFAATGSALLSHKLDGETIYPTLIFMTHYKLMDKCVLHVRVRSLLRPSPAEDFFCEIPKGGSLDIKLENIDAKIPQAMLKFPEIDGRNIPDFPMKKDFHLRDLLTATGNQKYINF